MTNTNNVDIAFGVPSYNHRSRVADAVGSLLMQTHKNLAIVACDDGSTDGTWEILTTLAKKDSRLHVFRNESRLGYIANAQKCLDKSRELFENVPYFAWGSDHDYWHPLWAERLLPVLEQDSRVQLVWPMVTTVDSDDRLVPGTVTYSETISGPNQQAILAHFWQFMNAGNMIYGLFRMDFLVLSSGLQRILLPDALLVAKSALVGEVRQVPETLWFRRYPGIASLDRQIRASFHDRDEARYQRRVPWAWTHYRHMLSFARKAAEHGIDLPNPPRKVARAYTAARIRRIASKRVKRAKTLRKLKKLPFLAALYRRTLPLSVRIWVRRRLGLQVLSTPTAGRMDP